MDTTYAGRGFYRAAKAVFTGSLVAGSGMILYGLNNANPETANMIIAEGVRTCAAGFAGYLIGYLVLGTSNFPLPRTADDCSANLEQRVK